MMTISKEEIKFRVRKTAALATLGAEGYMDVMMYFNLVEEKLAAHKENESDECPLCQLEKELDQAIKELADCWGTDDLDAVRAQVREEAND